MSDRILDIAESPAYLRVRDGLLCIRPDKDNEQEVTVPLAELAAVILTHPQITCTRTVLSGLAEAGAVVVACDDRFLPVAMMLPLTGYHAPARRLAAQANATVPLKKRLWQQLVKAKVRAQAQLLIEFRGDDYGLTEMSKQVRSGDTQNVEAQAARVYWPVIFNDTNFQRNFTAPDQNRFLNYGYAVLRAAVARAICAAGLHPGLGLHHHHRNNPYCLADDLIEPFRPIIDRAVVELVDDDLADAPMDKHIKAQLIQPVMDRYLLDGEQRTLFDNLGRLAASLANAFQADSPKAGLNLPDIS